MIRCLKCLTSSFCIQGSRLEYAPVIKRVLFEVPEDRISPAADESHLSSHSNNAPSAIVAFVNKPATRLVLKRNLKVCH